MDVRWFWQHAGTPAVTPTTVFVGDDQGSVHALNRMDGTKVWSKLVDMHAEAHLWSSPIYVPDADMVLVGVASGEEAVAGPWTFRGSVVALDAKTGEQRWKFFTTAADAMSGPGAAVWATPVVDVKRKLVIPGTGNAYSGVSGPLVRNWGARMLRFSSLKRRVASMGASMPVPQTSPSP